MNQSGSETLVLQAPKCIGHTALPALTPLIKASSASVAANTNSTGSARPAPTKRSQKYPAPLIFPPLSGQHRQTFIILHGRGSTTKRFGPPLLEHTVTLPPPSDPVDSKAGSPSRSHSPTFNISNLQTTLPHTRFVFPGASTRRATTYDRTPISQWFDMNPLTEPEDNEQLMSEGIRESTTYLHSLMEREARLVNGTRNVVVGGLSQGCAASLMAMLLWQGEPFKAFVGMAGWLPFREHLENLSNGSRSGWEKPCEVQFDKDGENPFEESTGGDEPESARSEAGSSSEAAIRLLRKELGLPATESGVRVATPGQTPVFLGHGDEDEKVPRKLGAEAAGCLSTLGFEVRHREYNGVGHRYSDKMLGDIVAFIGDISGPNRDRKPQDQDGRKAHEAHEAHEA